MEKTMNTSNTNNGRKRKGLFARFTQTLVRLKFTFILIIIIAAIISSAYLIRSCRDNNVSIYVNDDINITPAQITAMIEIGEWEFLSIEDEELIDTVRKGWFSDDELIRIYYGTLRLGFDMRKAGKDWITVNKDTVSVTLPQITLLDEDFIDEAKTKSFYESGSWSDKDRGDMYERARKQMRARCLTRENIAAAEQNAESQFRKMLQALGFELVKIKFERKKPAA